MSFCWRIEGEGRTNSRFLRPPFSCTACLLYLSTFSKDFKAFLLTMHFILCFSADRQPLLRRITMVLIFQAPQPAAAATPRPRLRPERESPRLRNQAPEYGLDALDQLRERARVARMVQLVAAQAEDAAADEDVEEIPPWTCQTCNTLNDHDESRCTQCHAWRMAPPLSPPGMRRSWRA